MKRTDFKNSKLNQTNICKLHVALIRNMNIHIKTNVLFLLTSIILLSALTTQAQRGVRIAYIDTEYILENIPEYQDATTQLNDKVLKWKNEIEEKLSKIEQKRKDLSNEKPLLTKELIEEREEDIAFEEKEILDYQQKRFGPNGDLMIQKKQLMQPIQDQIFAAVQDLAASRKYDFVFDKSSDATMLYSAKRYDLSEQILKSITRSSKRNQVQSKAERKAAEDEELIPEINEELEARETKLEEKKLEQKNAIEKRKQEILEAREAKKKEADEKRKKILEEREKAKQAKIDARNNANKTVDTKTDSLENTKTTETTETTINDLQTKTRAELIEENRLKKLAEREERKKQLQERKNKIIEERKKARDSINNNN